MRKMIKFWKGIIAKLRLALDNMFRLFTKRFTRKINKLHNLGSDQCMGDRDDVIAFWENYSHRSISSVGKIRCLHEKEHECSLQLWQLKNGRWVVAINSTSQLNCASQHYLFEGKLQEK